VTKTHITPEMRSVLGKEFTRSTSFPIAASDIRRWAIAAYYPAPPPSRYWDESVVSGPLIAPQEFNPFAWMSSEGPTPIVAGTDPDRQFRLLGVQGPGLVFQVNGGVQVSYGAPMRAGDVITSSSHISELTERTGRLGLMLFTTVDTVLTNQAGTKVRHQRMTVIRY
jgi:N-terminal half of MaoC dehydratase